MTDPKDKTTETITAAAIKLGQVICFVERPGRHHDIFREMDKAGMRQRGIAPERQGFVTSRGRFVGRELARAIAEEAGQLIASDKDADGVPFIRVHAHLFSEDVW